MMKKMSVFILASMFFAMNISAVSYAEEASFMSGDVDMDGVVTGHDTAMVSRYIHDEEYVLTEEQLDLADVNADGSINQADADMLYSELQVYHLGDVLMDGDGTAETLQINDASAVSDYLSYFDNTWSQVQLNLADADLSGDITINDEAAILSMIASKDASLPAFDEIGKYYFDTEFYIPGDVDNDGLLTISDAKAILSIYAIQAAELDLNGYSYLNITLSDADCNGVIDISDATMILTAYAENAAGME